MRRVPRPAGPSSRPLSLPTRPWRTACMSSPEPSASSKSPTGYGSSSRASWCALRAYLWEQGELAGAEDHWRAAHRLVPDNFSYKRQAWSLAADEMGQLSRYWQGPVPGKESQWPYDADWLTEVRAKGAENYYP